MVEYKSKSCVICGGIFTPRSPKHKTCSETCSVELRRETERERDKLSRRIFNRSCPFCAAKFETTDSKKKYCGSEECERKRCIVKAHTAERKRKGNRSSYTKMRYREVLHPDREVRDRAGPNHLLDQVADFFEVEGYTLVSTSYIGTRGSLKVVCPEGHLWETSFHSFKDSPNRCFTCFREKEGTPVKEVADTPHPEKEIADFVEGLVGVGTIRNDRTLIKPYELDVYVPAKRLAIEYCGLYWHSEVGGGKPRKYHYDKMAACEKEGVRLITVFEDEYSTKPDVVKSRIRNALGIPEHRAYARKCVFGAVDHSFAKKFLENNHLQGASGFKYAFGLFYQDELIMLMTFGPLSRTHALVDGKPTLELKRFASLPGWSVPGGASRLLKNATRIIGVHEDYKYLKSYCDMRYASIEKPVYETLGFKLVSRTTHTPHYVRGGKRFRNQGLRKTPEERLTGKTEWELRSEQGYDRIWDCGHASYVLAL